MKKLLLVLSLILVFSSSLFAQLDTLAVPAVTGDGDYYVNSLLEFVVGDTNAAGEQQHDVYKLERGQLYVIESALDIRNPLQIVADAPVADDPEKQPPMIIANVTADGFPATQNLINTWADLTIKNVELAGMCLNGYERGWGFGQALAVQDSFVTITMDGVWVSYNGWSVFATAQPHTSWFINRLHARNEVQWDPWTPFVFFLEQASVVDTFVVTNTTHFQSNGFFFMPPAVVNYAKIDHCTFVNLMKWPFHDTQWQREAYITNSIFYNASALSMTENEEEGQDSDNLDFSIINIDTLLANQSEADTNYAGPYDIPEADRIFEVKNNLYYFSDGVQDYWANNDSVKAVLWMNSRVEAMFADDATWPGLVAENNWNQDPMFNDFPELEIADTLLVNQCIGFREGGFSPDWEWDADKGQDFFRLLNPYPLPENFRSYSGLTGTDGKPLGDLKYYPGETSVEENLIAASEFTLKQNYPNPFNPTTTINYRLNTNDQVKLTVYNMMGAEVKSLVSEAQKAGKYSVTWNATNNAGVKVTSGVYFYKLEVGSNTAVKKMLLLK